MLYKRFRSLLVVLLLIEGSRSQSSARKTMPNLMGMRTHSRFQSQPIIAFVPCNNTDIPLPIPQYLVGSQSNNYHIPTILNYAPNTKPSSSEDDMDIGNRIFPPLSMMRPKPSQIPFLPNNNRLNSPNSIIDDHVEKAVEIENAAKFHLFTRRNPVVAQELRMNMKSGLNESHFSPSLETKLIFHGFTDVDAPGEWINVMKETYLNVADVNLIVADFSSFSLPNLFRSSALPIFASKRLTQFITFLTEETNATLGSIHVISRSYACHIVGLSGYQLQGKLGRITALEPSPKMTVPGISEIQLNKGDAQFVDAIHINGQRFFFHGSQFGLVAPIGHVDVYPHISERGLGCPNENSYFKRHSVRHCHLGRGVRYFTKSIKYPETYPMCKCQSFESYKAGYCTCRTGEEIMYLGQITNRSQGVFQLAPNSPQVPHYNPMQNLFG